ncbi:prolyl aminopeptidase [Naematelia encephala]|uniref:Prolyl aminopeptidase n=1 Tax=Naematelia encephala TaxID=71784 RepID=A0A1Y2B3B1_9TREE|nr:prolyl aminopeptidase [Naematelia encephala]
MATSISLQDIPLSYVEINGARLAYRTIGDPSLPLFITLHGGRGFGSHGSDFRAYAPLSNHYRIVSPDYRGHGLSSFTPPFTFAQIVEDIDALRKHFVGEARAVICGGSFGGYLAQQYAITFPDGVSHLILRGTAPSHEHEAEALEILQQRLERAPMASTSMLAKVFGAFKDDDEMRLVMFALGPLYAESTYDPDQGLESARKTIYRAESHNALYSEEEKYFDYRPRLREITAPTLIVVGDKDWICPPSQSEIIHKGVSGSELLVVPGANHSVHHEKNELVIAAIRDFLGRR